MDKITGMIRVTGFDQGKRSNRIYDKGKLISYPNTNKYPRSRIHTDAKSLPGNSGGAVIDNYCFFLLQTIRFQYFYW